MHGSLKPVTGRAANAIVAGLHRKGKKDVKLYTLGTLHIVVCSEQGQSGNKEHRIRHVIITGDRRPPEDIVLVIAELCCPDVEAWEVVHTAKAMHAWEFSEWERQQMEKGTAAVSKG